jgi:hypothetical protein
MTVTKPHELFLQANSNTAKQAKRRGCIIYINIHVISLWHCVHISALSTVLIWQWLRRHPSSPGAVASLWRLIVRSSTVKGWLIMEVWHCIFDAGKLSLIRSATNWSQGVPFCWETAFDKRFGAQYMIIYVKYVNVTLPVFFAVSPYIGKAKGHKVMSSVIFFLKFTLKCGCFTFWCVLGEFGDKSMEAIVLAKTDEVVWHYKNLNVICTKKAFMSLVLHIGRWRRYLWHKTTLILSPKG